MTDPLSLSVNPVSVSVDPGGVAEVVLQLQNRGTVVDEYVVEVLGDAAAWTSVDPPRVPTFPGGSASVRVSMRPPRASYPEAGTIPIGFRVRSGVDPSMSTVEECRLRINPFTEIGGEIAPKTARGRFSATHRLGVTNRGNAPVSVSVRAEVQQGDCQISVPPAPLELAAGERVVARIKVRPTHSHWQGGDEMHQYRLTLEPRGGGAPVALDAMMRQRPIARIPTALLVAAALLLGGAYVVYSRGPNPIENALRPPPGPTATTIATVQTPTPTPPPTPTPTCQKTVPGVPTGVTAIPGDGKATVSWTAATSSCGLPITAYTVTASPGNASASVAGDVTMATVQNLVDGTAYTVTVTAANSVGSGSPSTPVNVTPVCPTKITGAMNAQQHSSVGATATVYVLWNLSGGCGLFSGSIAANYPSGLAPKSFPIKTENGNLTDTIDYCVVGTFPVVYTLTLRDSSNQSITLSKTVNVSWQCIS